jgi:hypothetical protein
MMVVVLQNIGHFPAEKLEGNTKKKKVCKLAKIG